MKFDMYQLAHRAYNKAHQARPHAGWTSVAVLVLRFTATLPQNIHLHCGPCGRR
ncbi:hypothetical protein QFX18_05275 [Saccharophagus degradans]|uniref:hypothetical protein n=1 Tax=Saccharophagus degradans TaxID=86304 RepID=UPI0024782217|nr:hypothetical protein [Saccharophagus degradans]WGO99472.1 hypothetical protein QFX18_05275 [Saccharophagus degradans]